MLTTVSTQILLHVSYMIVLLNNVWLCAVPLYCSSLLTAAVANSTVKEYLKTAENDWPTMLKRLEAIRASLIKRNQFIINLTGAIPIDYAHVVWWTRCVLAQCQEICTVRVV
jgi:hypothetical protein